MVLSFFEKNMVPIILSLVSILLAWNWNRRVERKIEGQREERTRRAHEDITTLIIRNAVQSEISIQEMNLDYIINSTLRKYQIDETFFSKQEVLKDIYTEIVNNEYILVDIKIKLKKEVEGIIERLEIPVEEEVAETKEVVSRKKEVSEKLFFFLRIAVLVVAVGLLIVFSSYIYGYASSLEPPYLLLYIVSIVSIQIMIAREIFRHYTRNGQKGEGEPISEKVGEKRLSIGPR